MKKYYALTLIALVVLTVVMTGCARKAIEPMPADTPSDDAVEENEVVSEVDTEWVDESDDVVIGEMV